MCKNLTFHARLAHKPKIAKLKITFKNAQQNWDCPRNRRFVRQTWNSKLALRNLSFVQIQGLRGTETPIEFDSPASYPNRRLFSPFSPPNLHQSLSPAA